ncbi:MAG: hypothetical protein ACUVYA_11835 [Planctomycetota bacterium]
MLNREKTTALVAAVILSWTLVQAFAAAVAPTRVEVPDVSLPTYRPELIPRRFRTFEQAEPLPRNPFSIAEGWQALELVPMPYPPVPSAPRLVPSPAAGPPPESAGYLWEEGSPGAARPGGAL